VLFNLQYAPHLVSLVDSVDRTHLGVPPPWPCSGASRSAYQYLSAQMSTYLLVPVGCLQTGKVLFNLQYAPHLVSPSGLSGKSAPGGAPSGAWSGRTEARGAGVREAPRAAGVRRARREHCARAAEGHGQGQGGGVGRGTTPRFFLRRT